MNNRQKQQTRPAPRRRPGHSPYLFWLGAGLCAARAAPGRGGDVLNGWMAEQVPFFHATDSSAMTPPVLVVAGDKDDSRHFTDVGPDGHADPYRLAPRPRPC